jgi:outer membrane protein assembly factor BamB
VNEAAGRALRVVVAVFLFAALSAGGVGLAVLGWRAWGPNDEEQASPPVATGTDTGVVAEPPPPPEPVREVVWPMFGFDERRTHVAGGFEHAPPFDRVWSAGLRSLTEFPPAIANGRVFVASGRGVVYAFQAETGKIAWRRNLRRCIAASPAATEELVFVSLMDPAPCPVHDETKPGFLVALDTDTGKVVWRFKTGINESSPLLARGALYFGTWDGKVYAIDAESREPLWTYETQDQVKGGAAFARGKVYIGSYDGNVYALDADTGEEAWVASAGESVYATPTVAGGRVYAGSVGGDLYCFDADDGTLVWARGTGDAIYSSAAASKSTVFVGSLDGSLYAFDAVSGETRWTFTANGPIAGSPTIMAGIVYFSTLAGQTYGLAAKTGEERWSFPAGQYAGIVADAERVYLTTYSRVFALAPR